MACCLRKAGSKPFFSQVLKVEKIPPDGFVRDIPQPLFATQRKQDSLFRPQQRAFIWKYPTHLGLLLPSSAALMWLKMW